MLPRDERDRRTKKSSLCRFGTWAKKKTRDLQAVQLRQKRAVHRTAAWPLRKPIRQDQNASTTVVKTSGQIIGSRFVGFHLAINVHSTTDCTTNCLNIVAYHSRCLTDCIMYTPTSSSFGSTQK